MIFSGASKKNLERALAEINMASAPETTPFPGSNKSKKSKRERNRNSTSLDDQVPAPVSNNACAAPAPVTRHLEFNQAMTDFKVMFPKMEWATIETVLRANNGAVDATIDQLLTLTESLQDTGQHTQIDSAPLGYPGTPPVHPGTPPVHLGTPTFMGHSPPPMYRGPSGEEQPPPYSPPSPTSPFSQINRPGNRPTLQPLNTSAEDDSVFQEFMSTLQTTPPASQAHLSVNRLSLSAPSSVHRRRWNPPMLGDLPEHFLRIPTLGQTQHSMVSSHLRQRLQQNVEQRSSVDINDVEMQQMLHDERVALFMQNEEFMRELQHNPEFSAALENDVAEATKTASLRNHRLSLSHQTHPHPHHLQNQHSHSHPTRPHHLQHQHSHPSQPQIPMHRNVLSEMDSIDGAVGGAVGGGAAPGEDVVFRNKLKHMGKSTKVKFALMARKFNSKKKKKSSRAGLEGALSPSTLNLLESEEEVDGNLLRRGRPRVEENIYSDSNLI